MADAVRDRPISELVNISHRAEILDIQAMVIDFFSLVNSYNSYAAFYTLYSVVIWLAYSAICSSWLYVPGNVTDTNKLEWYALQMMATLFMCHVIGSLSSIRLASRDLYRLIATLAALDLTANAHKNDRWLVLMRHYSPLPLYCFTTFRLSEIS